MNALLKRIFELALSILSDPDPEAALTRAEKAILANAADDAADKALGVK